MFYFTSALCFALLSNSRLAFVMAVTGVHSTPLLRSLARALLVLQMASLPQGLSAIPYCIELNGIIANYEVWGLARSTSSGVTLAPMLHTEGINSFDVEIPHYTGIRGPHSSRQRRHHTQLSRYLFGSSSGLAFFSTPSSFAIASPLSLQGAMFASTLQVLLCPCLDEPLV